MLLFAMVHMQQLLKVRVGSLVDLSVQNLVLVIILQLILLKFISKIFFRCFVRLGLIS